MKKYCIMKDGKPIKGFSTKRHAIAYVYDIGDDSLKIEESHIYTISDVEAYLRRATQHKFRKLLNMKLAKDYIDGRSKSFYTKRQYFDLLEAAGWQIIDNKTIAKKVIRFEE